MMETIEIVVVMLAVGNIVGMLCAYQLGWNAGWRQARKEIQTNERP